MEIINLTPHPLRLGRSNAQEIPSSGVVRVEEHTRTTGKVLGIPVVVKTYGELRGLPTSREGVIYITSLLAAKAAWAQGRQDVFTTADPIRDESGRIIAAGALAANPEVEA